MSTLPGCFSFHVSCFMTLLGPDHVWKWVSPHPVGAQNCSELQVRYTAETGRPPGIFHYECGPPFHVYLPVYLHILYCHSAGSGLALHKVSTTSKSRGFPHLLAVARELPVWLWSLQCLEDHTYRVLVGLCGMSPGSACPVPVHRICFPRLWSVLHDSQPRLKNLRSLVLTYLRPLTNQFPILNGSPSFYGHAPDLAMYRSDLSGVGWHSHMHWSM
jgi:hypothetical protein